MAFGADLGRVEMRVRILDIVLPGVRIGLRCVG